MAAQTEQRVVEIIVNGSKAEASLKEMRAAAAVLNNQIQKLTPGTQEFIDKTKQLQEVRGRIKAVESDIKGMDSTMAKMRATVSNLAGIFGITFAVGTVVGFFKDSSKAAKGFEKALSELKSLTFASAEELEYFKQQAEEIGATTTLSASQAVDAFKLIGSAKPELLKNKEALAAVTKEAVTLAEAAGINLPEAATALTSSLNMFGIEAGKAKEVINALAAGSLEGSADINDINASLKNFGVVAASSNVSVNESVALIELLAEKSIKGSEAGTGLRNVLTKMATAKALPKDALAELERLGVNLDVVSDKTRPVNERLQEFSKISGDATAMSKVFGAENLVVGQTILGNVTKFNELNGKIAQHVKEGTVAAEQARINTNNMDGAIKGLQSATEALQISVGEKLNKVLTILIKSFTSLVLGLREAPKFVKENQDLFIALGVALVTFNAAQIAATASTLYYTAVEKGRALATRASAMAQTLLNNAMTANPIGLVIKAITLLVAGFVLLYNRSETVRGAIAGIASAASLFFQQIAGNAMKYLGGLADLLVGIFTMDVDKIKTGLQGSFDGLKGFWTESGKGVGDAFNKGFDDKLAAEKAEKEVTIKTTTEDGSPVGNSGGGGDDTTTAGGGGDGETDKERKAREKAEKAAERKRKLEEKHQEEMTALKQKYSDMAQKADQDIETLRLASSDRLNASKLAKLDEQHNKELNKIRDYERAVQANQAISEEEKTLLLDRYREQRDLMEQEYKAKKKQLEDEEKKAKKEKDLEELAIAEEEELLRIENKFLQATMSEQAKEDALFNIRKKALQDKLALINEGGQIENAETLKIRNQLLQLEQNHEKQKLDNIKKTEEQVRQIREAGYSAAKDFVNLGIELFGKEQAERGKNAKLFRAFSKGKILLDSAQEVAAIWRNANANPMNILLPGSGNIIAAAQTALAVIRTRNAVAKVDGAQFAQGGFTGSGMYVNGLGMLIDNTGYAVAGVVHNDEWVAPKWMTQHPQYANVIGWLESSRRRGFADGGFTTAPPPGAPDPGTNMSSQQMLQLMMAMVEETRAFRQEITTWQREIQVVNNPIETIEEADKILQVRNDAALK